MWFISSHSLHILVSSFSASFNFEFCFCSCSSHYSLSFCSCLIISLSSLLIPCSLQSLIHVLYFWTMLLQQVPCWYMRPGWCAGPCVKGSRTAVTQPGPDSIRYYLPSFHCPPIMFRFGRADWRKELWMSSATCTPDSSIWLRDPGGIKPEIKPGLWRNQET